MQTNPVVGAEDGSQRHDDQQGGRMAAWQETTEYPLCAAHSKAWHGMEADERGVGSQSSKGGTATPKQTASSAVYM
jgi:hypothetical protein